MAIPAKRKTWLIVLLGIPASILLLFGLLIAFIFVSAPYNPMLLAFLTNIEVYNDSGVDIWVTPIGMWEGSGTYGPLPRYNGDSAPARRSRQTHDIPLKAGGAVKITYDWDDINFRHLLVRTASGEVYITDTDKHGGRSACYSPEHDRYRIPPITEMQQAPAELLPCTRGESVQYSPGGGVPLRNP